MRANLERALRAAVADGRLVPGATLPPSRTLAGDLGIARNTVTEAYAQLVAEGWLVARQGSATRVAARPMQARPNAAALATRSSPCRYDLRAGFPDVSSFPHQEWLSAARFALAGASADSFGYGPAAGLPVLRRRSPDTRAHARRARRPERVVVCAGFTTGLRILARALRGRGVRRIGVEESGTRAIGPFSGRRPHPGGAAGGRARRGAGSHGRSGAVLLTSAHQFPLGVTLSADRRAAFTAWASRTGAIVIEDDYDGEFRYDRRALGACRRWRPSTSRTPARRARRSRPDCASAGSSCPKRWCKRCRTSSSQRHQQAPAIEQLTMAEFIDSGGTTGTSGARGWRTGAGAIVSSAAWPGARRRCRSTA